MSVLWARMPKVSSARGHALKQSVQHARLGCRLLHDTAPSLNKTASMLQTWFTPCGAYATLHMGIIAPKYAAAELQPPPGLLHVGTLVTPTHDTAPRSSKRLQDWHVQIGNWEFRNWEVRPKWRIRGRGRKAQTHLPEIFYRLMQTHVVGRAPRS